MHFGRFVRWVRFCFGGVAGLDAPVLRSLGGLGSYRAVRLALDCTILNFENSVSGSKLLLVNELGAVSGLFRLGSFFPKRRAGARCFGDPQLGRAGELPCG